MPTFSYTAQDRTGSQTTGSMAANNVAELRAMLRTKNLFMVEAREQGAGDSGTAAALSFGKRRVKLYDMVVMSRQLATLVRAGLSITECLHSVATQTENPTLAEVVMQVRLDVLSGSTLTDAMRKHPKVFSESYVALVSAGETGGLLESTLEMAANQLNAEAELREKVKAAFTYPTLVFIASVLVVTFMLVAIVPVFAKVYDQFHAPLPFVTLSLVLLSKFVVNYWFWTLVAGVIAFFAFRRWIKTEKGRYYYDLFKLKMPLLGKLNRKIAIARFAQTFAGMSRAGVPILRALAVSARASGNVIIIGALMKVAERVQQGASVAGPMENTGQFPSMVTRLIAAGETSGNLDEMLDELTLFYNRDIEYTVERLTRLLEPLMTVIVGGIVLFILLALYMPIFKLGDAVLHHR